MRTLEKKLKELSMHLLDLGKRNRLLNYKETGFRTIQILNTNSDLLFDKISNGTTLSVFSLDPVLRKYHKTIEGTKEEIIDYSEAKVRDIALDLLKNNELLCYKKGTPTEKVMKNIYKEYKSTCLEKGINPLYMTFGLVSYMEGKVEYQAPLLLIPIAMELEKGTFKMKEYEDEIILNPTFSYLLKTEYKVILDDYQEGDLKEYLSKISRVLEHHNMRVKTHMSLGIYSFLKMNMYNDLTSNTEKVIGNTNIQRLLDRNIEEKLQEKVQVFPVVNCDSSQLDAIEYATKGASFVLQGPPGSGKSQTITNIIASAIGNQKKVLFVSEKQAALNIVYENLKRAGLESFAIELHSHKTNKKEFIDELYKTATLPRYDIQNDVENIEHQYYFIKDRLEEYRTTLHAVLPNMRMSLYEVYSRFLSLPAPGFSYAIPSIERQDFLSLDTSLRLLRQYESLAATLGYDYHQSPFFGFTFKDLNYVRYDARQEFIALEAFLKNKVEVKNQINPVLPLHIINYQQLLESMDLLDKFVQLKHFLPEYFQQRKRTKLLSILEDYLKSSAYIEKSTISNFFQLDILKKNVTEYLYQFKLKSASMFKFFSGTYRRLKKELQLYAKVKMKDQDLIQKLEELNEYQKMKELLDQTKKELPSSYRSYEYEQIYQDLQSIERLTFDLELTEAQFRQFKNQFLDILIHFKEHHSFGYQAIASKFDAQVMNFATDDLELLYSKVQQMNKHLDLLDIHVQVLNLLDQLTQHQLLPYLDIALEHQLDLALISKGYEHAFYRAIIYYEVEKSPILKEFSTLGIDQMIEEFKKVDALHLETNKATIVSKLSKLRPDDSIMAGSKFSILVKEYHKSRKQKPIRMLIEEIQELIFDLKPVFLMSPLSVSTYLNSSLNMFDLVIFDEASQVFAWDALGAIYRAKQCIVIGDSKQMPPSNFFNSSISEEEDDYEDELESILDKGTTVFTTKYLNWHYRSRSEELIDFSNKAFYDARLITIPQAKKHELGFGIDFYPLKDGIYDVKTRTNLKEALFIVDLVCNHYQTRPDKSLGVVAFSNAQAELIETKLEERVQKEPKLQSFFQEDVEEPFFIKNLESVQGDERDCIIFSICYGYNENNKFYQRFGPLNNVGGERRLNVAITRAKYNISVVSSIRSTDIRLDNTESLGVKLLKNYLEYAEKLTQNVLKSNPTEDGIIKSISTFLTDHGFLVQQKVGNSSFKIDIAIQHPVTREYVLAIMLDGASYCIGNCSDVNRLQELLLQRLGWHYYRIFSTLWINATRFEQEKLLTYLEKLFTNTLPKPEKSIPEIDFLVEDEADIDDIFEEYQMVSEEEIRKLYQTKSTAKIIYEIVRKEEPISIEFLLKRICFMYGRTKVTNVVRNLFERDLESLELINESGFLMTKHITSKGLRIHSNRMIEQVPRVELEDAIYRVVQQSNGITKVGCFKMVVKLLGYDRMSDNATEILENALVFVKLDGKLIEKSECLYL